MPAPAVRDLLLFGGAFSPARLPGLQLWLAPESPITLAAGMAAQFNSASSRYLSVAGNAVLRGSTGGWWRAGWFYHDSTTLAQTIMDTSSAFTGIKLATGALGANVILSVGNGAAVKTATFTISLSTATWYFFYIFYDGTNIGININNGTQVTTALAAAFSPGSQAFDLGGDIGVAADFDGRIQCVALDDGTLTAGQQTTLYNGGVPFSFAQYTVAALPNTSLRYWELNEPSGTRADLGLAADNLASTNSVGTAAGTCLNAVSQWNDLSGNSNHAVQATQSRKPAYRINGQNKLAYAQYDGVNDYMQTATFAALHPKTVFIVYSQIDDGLSQQYVFDGDAIDTSQLNWTSAGTTTAAYAGAGLSFSDAQPVAANMTAVFFNGASGAIYRNGVQKASGNLGTTANTKWTIGADGTPGLYSNIRHYEFICYSRALTTAEQKRVERYLSAKYAIALAG